MYIEGHNLLYSCSRQQKLSSNHLSRGRRSNIIKTAKTPEELSNSLLDDPRDTDIFINNILDETCSPKGTVFDSQENI